MTWNAYNRRKEVLREMLAIADQRRNDITLTDLLDTVDGGREVFSNETELLFDMQMNWFQRLSGQLDRLLIETDAPYLTPHPYRGKRNEPAYIPLIAQAIADLQQIDVAAVAEKSSKLARRTFPKLVTQ